MADAPGLPKRYAGLPGPPLPQIQAVEMTCGRLGLSFGGQIALGELNPSGLVLSSPLLPVGSYSTSKLSGILKPGPGTSFILFFKSN